MAIPNLFIPGAERAATSTLVMLLGMHEDVYIGKRKEPHFFSQDGKYLQGTDLYRSFYDKYQSQEIIVDASQSYMPLDFVPQRIYETLGANVRFLFTLRNPIDRVVSAFSNVKINLGWEVARNLTDIIPQGLEDMTLEALLSYEAKSVKEALRCGIIKSGSDILYTYGFPCRYFYVSSYSRHISNYLTFFDRQNFLFLTFEEVTQNQQEAMCKVADFLEIDPGGFDLDTNIHVNPTVVYKNRIVSTWWPPTKRALKRLVPDKIRYRIGMMGIRWLVVESKWLVKKPKYQFPDRTYYRLLEMFQPEIDETEKLSGLDLSSWKIM